MANFKANKQVAHQGAKVVHSENIEVSDFNFLPSDELQKLKECDPRLLDLYIKMVQDEKDHRHGMEKIAIDLDRQKVNHFYQNANFIRRKEKVGMFYAFMTLMAGMFLSGFMIHQNLNIQGSIFAGGTLIASASIFVSRNRTQENKQAGVEARK